MEIAIVMVSASMLGHRLLQKKVEPFSGTAEKRFDFEMLVSASSECHATDRGNLQN
jgi:hypothetical protein